MIIFSQKMPYSTLDDFEPLSTIGSGSYGTCKKIRRKKDGKVIYTFYWIAIQKLDYLLYTNTKYHMDEFL